MPRQPRANAAVQKSKSNAMQEQRWYVVFKGTATGAVQGWYLCDERTRGFLGARFARFATREAAELAWRGDSAWHPEPGASGGDSPGPPGGPAGPLRRRRPPSDASARTGEAEKRARAWRRAAGRALRQTQPRAFKAGKAARAPDQLEAFDAEDEDWGEESDGGDLSDLSDLSDPVTEEDTRDPADEGGEGGEATQALPEAATPV